MSFKQNIIRYELVRTEKSLNKYQQLWDRGYPAQNYVIHLRGRRRFFLKDLLKVQLKEFSRE